MTVLCDDAGWGDLLGGVVLACLREETGDFTYRIIEIHFFQEPAFDEKKYLGEASKLVYDMLLELQVDDEPIKLCTGYILSQAVMDLIRVGFKVSTGKIEGKLQELGEQVFLDELRRIGYTPLENRETDGRMRARSFYSMLNWMNINPERRKYAKTGWRFFTGKPKRQPPWRRGW